MSQDGSVKILVKNSSPVERGFCEEWHLLFNRYIDSLRHMPYDTAAVYAEGIRNASIEKIAKLIKIVGMFMKPRFTCFGLYHNRLNKSFNRFYL